MIPAQNVDNLMLKEEVLEAVKKGLFHIYAVRNIEEGIELLCGVPAGTIKEDGSYPEESVFGKVDRKLMEFNAGLSRSGSGNSETKGSACCK